MKKFCVSVDRIEPYIVGPFDTEDEARRYIKAYLPGVRTHIVAFYAPLTFNDGATP